MGNDSLPLVLIDFDGVVNQFPDDKVRCRQNSTAWMKPDDPRIQVYDPRNWFIPDHSGTVWAGHYHGNIRIHWASQLVDRIKALDAEIIWLSTWQPYIPALDVALDVDWEALHWYDPITREGRYTGKRRSVINHLKAGRPILSGLMMRKPPMIQDWPFNPASLRLQCLALDRIRALVSVVHKWR